MSANRFHPHYTRYKARIEKHLLRLITASNPACFYQPINYVLKAGGKRVRAVLVMLSSEAVGGTSGAALNAACAIEILHNFTLVHDDVMDNSSLRRGRPTVHTKWDTNIAILAGDGLAAYAYNVLLKTKIPAPEKILTSFTNAFIDVCEGQGLDKEFETREDVTIQEYLAMIDKKTARMLASACEIGARIGGGTSRQVNALRTFGASLGVAFQIQDDVLDITAKEAQLGKPIGGDVMEGKKTYLLLKALERATGDEKKVLEKVVRKEAADAAMVKKTLQVYHQTGVIHDARLQVNRYTMRAQQALLQLPDTNARLMLGWLSQQLLDRNS